jgi:hypothetical protein
VRKGRSAGKTYAWREARSLEPKLRNGYVEVVELTCQRLATLPHNNFRVPGLVPGIRLCAHGQKLLS